MKPSSFTRVRLLAAFVALAVSCGASLASKPDDDQRGKGKKAKQSQKAHAKVPVGAYFVEHQRVALTTYYGQQRKAGHCPPGLAKKNNGCMPPGQARKWQMGQPLPSGVVYYPVPQAVVVQIGPAPAGYRYVRVANDLLLIAIGTQLVVDAVQDLMAM